MTVRLGSLSIGQSNHPVIVAELSGNHNGSLSRVLEMVEAIAASGAQAVKLQTYTPDTMTLNVVENEFLISDQSSPWHGENLYALYKRAQTPWEWHEPIFRRARQLGLVVFSTPFDATAVEFLETLDVPVYKVASFENTDLPLIRKIAETRKPMIVSTGMATLEELDETVRTVRAAGCRDLILLKCTSTYPTSPGDSHLLTIPHMRARFNCEVGLSDHTVGIGVSVAAVALGAAMIEKHVTLSRRDGGVDSAFSLEPHELTMLVTETHRAWEALGQVRYGPTEAEKNSLPYRRSLYIAQDMKVGDKLTQDNLRVIRPGRGLAPKHYEQVLGRRVVRDVKRGTPVSWGLLGEATT